jgi:hypothetical protein
VSRSAPRDLFELPARHLVVEVQNLGRPWVLLAYLAGALSVYATALGTWRGLRDTRGPAGAALLLFAVPVLAALALSALALIDFHPRYVLVASVGVALLVAVGLEATRPRWLASALGLCLLASLLAISLGQKRTNLREDFRGATADVRAAWRPGDAILVITGTPAGFSGAAVRHYLRDEQELLDSVVGWDDLERLPAETRLHVVYRTARYAEDRMRAIWKRRALLLEAPPRLGVQAFLFDGRGTGAGASSG